MVEAKADLEAHGMAKMDEQLLIFGCSTWERYGTGMNRQRELFEEILGQNLARRLRETFNWTLDLTERLTFDLTIDLTERLTFDETSNFERAGKFLTG